MSNKNTQYIFYTIDHQTAKVFEVAAKQLELPLTIELGDLVDVSKVSDILITPGNSYGIMDGGFDEAVVRRFGNMIQSRVSETLSECGGYLPVGNCVSVPVYPHPGTTRWLVYAPTMAIPQPITNLRDVYDSSIVAFNEANRLALEYPDIGSIGFTAMGGLTGGVPLDKCAEITLLTMVLSNLPPIMNNWGNISRREELIQRITR